MAMLCGVVQRDALKDCKVRTCRMLASTAGSAAALRTNSGIDFLTQGSNALVSLAVLRASMHCTDHTHLKTLIHCALPGCPGVVLL